MLKRYIHLQKTCVLAKITGVHFLFRNDTMNQAIIDLVIAKNSNVI